LFWGAKLLCNPPFFGFFELGGVSKGFVYYFVFSAYGFWLDVFDDDFSGRAAQAEAFAPCSP
jgi:hypothetical protein